MSFRIEAAKDSWHFVLVLESENSSSRKQNLKPNEIKKHLFRVHKNGTQNILNQELHEGKSQWEVLSGAHWTASSMRGIFSNVWFLLVYFSGVEWCNISLINLDNQNFRFPGFVLTTFGCSTLCTVTCLIWNSRIEPVNALLETDSAVFRNVFWAWERQIKFDFFIVPFRGIPVIKCACTFCQMFF